MKVLQIIQKPQLRGAEIFACQLANALRQLGVDVIVITLFEGEAKLPFDGTTIHLNLSGKKRLFDWQGWRKLAEIIKHEKPDIIQANAGDTLKYAVFSKLFFRWRGALIFRNASTVSLYIKSKVVKYWNLFLYKRTDFVISVSASTKKDLVNLFPFVNKKATVIPIGVVSAKAEAFQKDEKSLIVLHIGGFSFEKNHEGIIRIFESFKSKYDHAILWLVGDGTLRKSVERIVKVKGLESSVKFWGAQHEPLRFLKSSDIFILPSIIEGLPGAILEAFYCKVPVVAYDVGGISEIVIPEQTGWLVEKGNETKFTAEMIQCIDEREIRLAVVENAYRLVNDSYTIEVVANQFLACYRQLTFEI
jgi:L-malate glycosyltransferase